MPSHSSQRQFTVQLHRERARSSSAPPPPRSATYRMLRPRVRSRRVRAYDRATRMLRARSEPPACSELDRLVGVLAGGEGLGLVALVDHLDLALEDDALGEHHLALDRQLAAADERRRAVRHE